MTYYSYNTSKLHPEKFHNFINEILFIIKTTKNQNYWQSCHYLT